MKNWASAWMDRLLGRGKSAVTVPAMDGALQPNTRLDEARVVEAAAAPDNLLAWRGTLLYTSGVHIRQAGVDEPLQTLPAPIACLAAWHDEILLAGLEDGGIVVCQGPGQGRQWSSWADDRPIVCPTAMLFIDRDTLIVAEGSSRNRPADWQRDLMEKNALGSIWQIDLSGDGITLLADGLAYPNGLACVPGDTGLLLVSESWQHRLVRLDTRSGVLAEVLGDLPAYPGRLSPAEDGGLWLALFASRSQLVELVLREPRYRRDMMAELDRDHWICPALSSKRSYKEPMQRGGLKQMGILKPWAPARSYGLALHLDANLDPTASLHSRADGRRHGITSLCAMAGTLYAASRGGDAVLAMEP